MIQTKLIHICSEEVSDAERILNSTLQEIQRNGHHIEDIRELSIKGTPHVAIVFDNFAAPAVDETETTDESQKEKENQKFVISTTPTDGKIIIIHHIADIVDITKIPGWEQQGCNGDRVAGMDNSNLLVIDTWSDTFLSEKLDEYVQSTMASVKSQNARTTRYTIHEVLVGTNKIPNKKTGNLVTKYVPGKVMWTVFNSSDDTLELSRELFAHTIEYMQKQSSILSTSQEKKDDNK